MHRNYFRAIVGGEGTHLRATKQNKHSASQENKKGGAYNNNTHRETSSAKRGEHQTHTNTHTNNKHENTQTTKP